MGKLVANDPESYRYLAESIRMHPDQATLKAMMETAGFERVTYHQYDRRYCTLPYIKATNSKPRMAEAG